MNEFCDLCGNPELCFAYRPPTGARGLAVYVCPGCGLVQSLPRIDHVAARTLAVSSGADWGNVRYGKGFRTERAVEILSRTVEWDALRHCLDVGANRGSFVLRLRQLAHQAHVLAVEPDASVVAEYANAPGIELLVRRVEEVSLPEDRFDLAYCSHTLEHLRSPREVLSRLARAMRAGAVLFVEVPNLDFLNQPDVVEEWFIDKHLYHFSPATLRAYLEAAGFRLIEGLSEWDSENITLVARKTAPHQAGQAPVRDGATASDSFDLIERYQAVVRKNQSALRSAALRIHHLTPRRVVVWGAGRIFDSLVRYGGLDVSRLAGVVDKHLGAFVESVHGCRLLRPEELPRIVPGVVVVASRAYFNEIRSELLGLVPDCEVLGRRAVLRPVSRGAVGDRAHAVAYGSPLNNVFRGGAMHLPLLSERARRLCLVAIHRAGSGHPGGSLSAADLLTYLYSQELRLNDPDERDRFVLSKGHACPALYAVAAEAGLIPHRLLLGFRKLGSPLQGHPHVLDMPWVETSTGSLGQGFSAGLGMALGLRYKGSSARVYVMLGDGELQEGEVWEAAMCAGHYGTDNLCAIVDYNKMQSDDRNAHIMGLEPLCAKWKAFNWHVLEVDGHDFHEIGAAFAEAKQTKSQPTVIIAHTIKGKGVSYMEGSPLWHGSVKLRDEELVTALQELGATEDETEGYLNGTAWLDDPN